MWVGLVGAAFEYCDARIQKLAETARGRYVIIEPASDSEHVILSRRHLSDELLGGLASLKNFRLDDLDKYRGLLLGMELPSITQRSPHLWWQLLYQFPLETFNFIGGFKALDCLVAGIRSEFYYAANYTRRSLSGRKRTDREDETGRNANSESGLRCRKVISPISAGRYITRA